MKSHCRNGHPRSQSYTSGSGRVVCRTCVREKQAERTAREFKGGTGHVVRHSAPDRSDRR